MVPCLIELTQNPEPPTPTVRLNFSFFTQYVKRKLGQKCFKYQTIFNEFKHVVLIKHFTLLNFNDH